nr:MAG TPA: hypothetical protein [Caudoviricetes sp.]
MISINYLNLKKGDKGDILKKGIFENQKRKGHLLIGVFLLDKIILKRERSVKKFIKCII